MGVLLRGDAVDPFHSDDTGEKNPMISSEVTHCPPTGSVVTAHTGDTFTAVIETQAFSPPAARLRTNIGRAHIRRREIVENIEAHRPILSRDWHDIPMAREGEARFSVRIPLCEVGVFEAKAYFTGPDGNPVWPAGENVRIKVEPAGYARANTIYSLFVRLFGAGNTVRDVAGDSGAALLADLDGAGYTVIPPSGTFRDVLPRLDFIINRLGFRIIQLLPVFPVPTTYARMGRFGSPFAALDLTNVDPALARFDRETTPMDQFVELVDEIHRRGGKVFLDIPLNHTGWASDIHIHHPEWFARKDEGGTFRSPGAWGVTWEDLVGLDYADRTLWMYVADVLVFWADRGVDGFRCDAGYKVPREAWTYIVARVRMRHPETIFFLEGLGGKVSTTAALLGAAGLDWAYSELFQNYDRDQIEHYLPECIDLGRSAGTMVHFAETHDNNRLASRSKTFAALRTALAALCSTEGGFGITCGVEWFADEKIDVHGITDLRWGAADNLAEHLATLNRLLVRHPSFGPGTSLRLVQSGGGNNMVLLRESAVPGGDLLVAANLDTSAPTEASWLRGDYDCGSAALHDLLSGREVHPARRDDTLICALGPGEVLCLASGETWNGDDGNNGGGAPGGLDFHAVNRRAMLRCLVLEILAHYSTNGTIDRNLDIEAAVDRFVADPIAFCGDFTGAGLPADVVTYRWPHDARREVMVPPGHFMLVAAENPFRVKLTGPAGAEAVRCAVLRAEGSFFTMIPPRSIPVAGEYRDLEMAVYGSGAVQKTVSPALYLPAWENAVCEYSRGGRAVREGDCYALATNGRGAMAHAFGDFGFLRSKYDALLAANPRDDCPADRLVMLTRCRVWVVLEGYSTPLDYRCCERFAVMENGDVSWRFEVPCGCGREIYLRVVLRMHAGRNAASLVFGRERPGNGESLADDTAVTVIVRPDVESRINHAVTKAYTGPEREWPAAVTAVKTGFDFGPPGSLPLHLRADRGCFVPEPEWTYAIDYPFDRNRGFEGCGDLFSPGYFSIDLAGGERVRLDAFAEEQSPPTSPDLAVAAAGMTPIARPRSVEEAAFRAMADFLAARSGGTTVIAGYPWFLDWGRDTLIALRGFIAAGYHRESREILAAFAAMERGGTLPNALFGADDSNRDTADAPLWLIIAAEELLRRTGTELLDTDCGGRSLRDVMRSIIDAYIAGCPNGVRMDDESGLVYSPPHFTWMDTDFPAGTPREGYPVEIQALWFRALRVCGALFGRDDLGALATRVADSIRARYSAAGMPGLSDSLHADGFVPAAGAVADDHVRPNQLLAITLGAVGDRGITVSILEATEPLLVPGAIRSLADAPVTYHLRVEKDGVLLNDPSRPYRGRYEGDEDTARKPAYHNGTAWTWPFPLFCEAALMVYGRGWRDTALSILASAAVHLGRECIGHVPEIVDGDAPHTIRGCGAQAWGASELYRVFRRIREW